MYWEGGIGDGSHLGVGVGGSSSSYPAPMQDINVFPRLDNAVHSLEENTTGWYPSTANAKGTPMIAQSAGFDNNGGPSSSFQHEIDAARLWMGFVENNDAFESTATPADHRFTTLDFDTSEVVSRGSTPMMDIDPHANFLAGKEAVFSRNGGQNVPRDYQQSMVHSVATTMKNSSVDNFASVWRPPENNTTTKVRRKRRIEELVDIKPITRDPFHLWSDSNAVVTWGRTEQVQEAMADRALGVQLSRHLVDVYFLVVHLSFPVSRLQHSYF